jgi:hypothetical protein
VDCPAWSRNFQSAELANRSRNLSTVSKNPG